MAVNFLFVPYDFPFHFPLLDATLSAEVAGPKSSATSNCYDWMGGVLGVWARSLHWCLWSLDFSCKKGMKGWRRHRAWVAFDICPHLVSARGRGGKYVCIHALEFLSIVALAYLDDIGGCGGWRTRGVGGR